MNLKGKGPLPSLADAMEKLKVPLEELTIVIYADGSRAVGVVGKRVSFRRCYLGSRWVDIIETRPDGDQLPPEELLLYFTLGPGAGLL